MPELDIQIGGRTYTVACQDGEELHLQTAAAALNAEAEVVVGSGSHVPESRMLLMAGLMLADKIAAVAEVERTAEEKVAAMEKQLKKAEKEVANLKTQPAPLFEPQQAEPVDDTATRDALTRIAEDLEQIADALEAEQAD